MDTLLHAKQELNKYYYLTTGLKKCEIELIIEPDLKRLYPDKYSEKFDDAYTIKVLKGKGTIAGLNARSVLQAVYRLFYELGSRFLYPTAKGEKIVKKSPQEITVSLEFVPSYRHRGICIEGAVSMEQLEALVDWMPKVGLNSYFIQFRDCYQFLERWYKHNENTVLKPEEFNEEISATMTQKLVELIQLKGLIYHKVGHGWTSRCLGFNADGWYTCPDSEIPEDKRNLLALVKGKRGFFGDIPINTHLCYSNPCAIELLTDEVLTYAKNHPEVDILHFWLADNFNNFCECEECMKETPTDYYVKLLNLLDEKLTKNNISTKIVFLIYNELLWKSNRYKIKNQDRFILMFAPSTRTYTKPYVYEGKLPRPEDCVVKPFKHNQIEIGSSIKENLSYLYDWQKEFSGDSFLFDYHMIWDTYKDYSGLNLGYVMSEDVRALRDLKLNGLISCQVQRAFFPTPIVSYVMAQTLADKSKSYDSICEEVFTTCFGKYADLAKEFFEVVKELFPHKYFRLEAPIVDEQTAFSFKKAEMKMDYYSLLLQKVASEYKEKDIVADCLQKSVFLAEVLKRLSPLLVAKAKGAKWETLKNKFTKIQTYISRAEKRNQYVLDSMFYICGLRGFLENDSHIAQSISDSSQAAIGVNQNFLKHNNQKLIVKRLRKMGMSCSELAKELQLSNAGIMNLVDELKEEQVLIESDEVACCSVGRRPIILEINRDCGVGAVIKLPYGEENGVVCLVDMQGNVLEQKHFVKDKGSLSNILQSFVKEIGLQKRLLSVVIVGDDENYDGDDFKEQFGMEPIVVHDIDCYMLAEREKNSFQYKDKNVLLVTVDDKIKASYALKGTVCNIGNGGSEFGKQLVNVLSFSNNLMAQDLNAYSSISGITNNVCRLVNNSNGLNIFSAYISKEKPIYDIVSESAKVLAGTLKNIIYAFDIDVIVIGGQCVKFGKRYLSIIQEVVKPAKTDILVKFSEVKNAVLIGAIERAVETGLNYLIDE